MCPDALVNANRARINILALGARLPTIYPDRAISSEAAGLMSYGPNIADLFRRAARLCRQDSARGEKPAEDLPVQAPTEYETCHQPQDRQGARPRRAADHLPTR